MPSESVKIYDNRIPPLIPSRVDLKNVSRVFHGALTRNVYQFCRDNVLQLLDPRGVVH